MKTKTRRCKKCGRAIRFRNGRKSRIYCRICQWMIKHPKKAVNRAQEQPPRAKEVVGEFVIRISIEKVER